MYSTLLLRAGSSSILLLALLTTALLVRLWTTRTLLYNDARYLDQYNAQFPSIPKIIWYKLGAEELTTTAQERINTCISANPSYDVQVLSDDDAADFVNIAFAHRPDILDTYFGLALPIVQFDMLRYMLLYDQGGVWFDVGTSCSEIPIDEWIPRQYLDDTNLVLGRESGAGSAPGSRRQFASWIMMAAPGSPHMLAVVEDIVEALQQTMRYYEVALENVTMAMTGDATVFSGPGRLTRGIMRSLEDTLNRTVELDEVSSVLMPKLIGDVLIMPRRSFSTSVSADSTDEELLPQTLATFSEVGNSWV